LFYRQKTSPQPIKTPGNGAGDRGALDSRDNFIDDPEYILTEYILSYNEERPHSSSGNIPPAEFERRLLTENSSLDL
jgi:transposase InsO family protein